MDAQVVHQRVQVDAELDAQVLVAEAVTITAQVVAQVALVVAHRVREAVLAAVVLVIMVVMVARGLAQILVVETALAKFFLEVNMKINNEISEYLERLMFEMVMTKRELDTARKLDCDKQIICSACRKARLAEIKFLTAREEFATLLEFAIPNMTTWKLDYKSQEVTYETD